MYEFTACTTPEQQGLLADTHRGAHQSAGATWNSQSIVASRDSVAQPRLPLSLSCVQAMNGLAAASPCVVPVFGTSQQTLQGLINSVIWSSTEYSTHYFGSCSNSSTVYPTHLCQAAAGGVTG